MNVDFDLAVVGSGFGGSLVSMIARKLGRSVIMIERGKHPRFAIGESSTPLANLLWEELAQRYGLDRLLPLAKWGTWQHAYPNIACGLKRGFTFYQHQIDRPFGADPDRQRQLLVAASPADRIADTHWYRPDFDHFLAEDAKNAGVEYLDQTTLTDLRVKDGSVDLTGHRFGIRLKVKARFLIDATGPCGYVYRNLGLTPMAFDYLPATQGLYFHFTGVRRVQELGFAKSDESPPYPVDDAALHHVFDGGWIWVLRFNNGITSAGVAATDSVAREFRFADGESAWQRLLRRLPSVQEQFREARAEIPFIHAPRLSFRSALVSGPGWAMLPSAAGFIDPLLSTGFSLTLLGIARLAGAIERDWGSARFAERLESYSRQTIQELLAAERLVAALYSRMNDFPVFTALARLYFAAVSFSEAARRLNRPERAASFLLHDHPWFGPRAHDCCQQVLRERSPREMPLEIRADFLAKVLDAIRPIDAAGLSDPRRRNWFPARAEDLLEAAPKFGASVHEMRSLLARCGFLEADMAGVG